MREEACQSVSLFFVGEGRKNDSALMMHVMPDNPGFKEIAESPLLLIRHASKQGPPT